MEDNATGTSARPLIATVVLLCSLLLHALTIPLFALASRSPGHSGDSPPMYGALLCTSAALAVLMYLVSRVLHFRLLLGARLLLLLIAGAPFERYVTTRLVLLLILFMEASIYEEFPGNLVFCLLSLASSLTVAVAGERDRPYPPQLVHDLIACGAVGLFVAVLACMMAFYRERMARYGREMEKTAAAAEELMRAQMGYLEYAEKAEQRSTESERNRLSAELHDSLGYTFTNLKMMLEAAKDLIEQDPVRLRDLLETGLAQVQQGMTETRKALYLVRERHEPTPPLLTSVHRMLQVFRKATGVDVSVDYANFPADCGAAVDLALYHFIQEGLVNSFRHGRASRIRVNFWTDEEKLQVTIQDNGRGMVAIKEGIGIRGMRERLGRLGGTLGMQNTPEGFLITARLPAREE